MDISASVRTVRGRTFVSDGSKRSIAYANTTVSARASHIVWRFVSALRASGGSAIRIVPRHKRQPGTLREMGILWRRICVKDADGAMCESKNIIRTIQGRCW